MSWGYAGVCSTTAGVCAPAGVRIRVEVVEREESVDVLDMMDALDGTLRGVKSD